jgi:hypothetical protein
MFNRLALTFVLFTVGYTLIASEPLHANETVDELSINYRNLFGSDNLVFAVRLGNNFGLYSLNVVCRVCNVIGAILIGSHSYKKRCNISLLVNLLDDGIVDTLVAVGASMTRDGVFFLTSPVYTISKRARYAT